MYNYDAKLVSILTITKSVDNKIANIKERILHLIDSKGYTKELFFKNLGVSYGNFKGENKKRPLNSNTLADILSIIPDVNAEWLLTGNGEMLKTTPDVAVEPENTHASEISDQQRTINELQERTNERLDLKIKELNRQLQRIHKTNSDNELKLRRVYNTSSNNKLMLQKISKNTLKNKL